MLRDFPSGLTLAAVTGTLYALKMYLALLHWNFGDDACDLLVLVGIMLSATGFFGEFVAAARRTGACSKPAPKSTSANGASMKALARERSG